MRTSTRTICARAPAWFRHGVGLRAGRSARARCVGAYRRGPSARPRRRGEGSGTFVARLLAGAPDGCSTAAGSRRRRWPRRRARSWSPRSTAVRGPVGHRALPRPGARGAGRRCWRARWRSPTGAALELAVTHGNPRRAPLRRARLSRVLTAFSVDLRVRGRRSRRRRRRPAACRRPVLRRRPGARRRTRRPRTAARSGPASDAWNASASSSTARRALHGSSVTGSASSCASSARVPAARQLALGDERRQAVRLARQRAQDVERDHVARALPDAVQRRVAQQPRHRRLLDVAVAAQALQRLGGVRRRALADPVLGDRGARSAGTPCRPRRRRARAAARSRSPPRTRAPGRRAR